MFLLNSFLNHKPTVSHIVTKEVEVFARVLSKIAKFMAHHRIKGRWKVVCITSEWQRLTFFPKGISLIGVFAVWIWFTATTTFQSVMTRHQRFFQFQSVGRPAMLWYRGIAKKSIVALRKLTRLYRTPLHSGLDGVLNCLTAQSSLLETVVLFQSAIILRNSKVFCSACLISVNQIAPVIETVCNKIW